MVRQAHDERFETLLQPTVRMPLIMMVSLRYDEVRSDFRSPPYQVLRLKDK